MSEKKKIRIVEVYVHPKTEVPRIEYEMDFGEYGVVSDSVNFWRGITEDEIKQYLRTTYRGLLSEFKSPSLKTDYMKLKDKDEEFLI